MWGAGLSLIGIVENWRHQIYYTELCCPTGKVWSKALLLHPQDEWNLVIQIGVFISSDNRFHHFSIWVDFCQQAMATDQASYFPLLQDYDTLSSGKTMYRCLGACGPHWVSVYNGCLSLCVCMCEWDPSCQIRRVFWAFVSCLSAKFWMICGKHALSL